VDAIEHCDTLKGGCKVELNFQISRLTRPDPSTKARSVIASIKGLSGIDISFCAAFNTINTMHNSSKTDHFTSFKKVPSYINTLKAANPHIYAETLYIQGTILGGVFIAPSAIRNAWGSLRNVISIDGNFPKGPSQFTLLLACTYDSDNHIVIMAWGVVPSESGDSWEWFC
jgi:hypothetical protein